MNCPRTHRRLHRRLGPALPRRAVALAALVVALLTGCGDGATPLLGHGRLDLLLDQQHVSLDEGFGPFTELFVEHDLLGRFNRDRPELPIPVPRACALTWDLDGCEAQSWGVGPSELRLGVARLNVGPDADGSFAELWVEANQFPEGSQYVEVPLPSMPADPGADPSRWREGPVRRVVVPLPKGTCYIRLVMIAKDDDPPPAGAGVALLSPHIVQAPHALPPTLTYSESTWLLDAVPAESAPVLLGQRQVQGREPAAPVSEVVLPAAQVVGAFEARSARHALALSGAGSLTLALEDARAGDRLVTAVALDRRLPPGTRARLELSDESGAPLLSQVVDSDHWTDLELVLPRPLTALTLTLTSEALTPAPTVVVEPDFALGDYVQVGYELNAPRLGLAELRIERPRAVPWRRASVSRPSVVVLHVETLRADLLDASTPAGDPLMPNLQRLASLTRRYTHAVAPSPWTLPSTATLLTGLYPSAHGVVHHDRSVLPTDTPTLAEKARAAGVATGAIATNDLLDPHKGYARGFGSYAFVPLANARAVHDLAAAFVDDHVGRQYLLFVHGWDPHHPWDAPAPFGALCVTPELAERDMHAASERSRTRLLAGEQLTVGDPDMRFLEQTYRGEVAYWDELLGDLLDHLVASGLDATTSVIVTSDHGEEFGEHGLFGHGSQLFDESLRVPLVVAGAGAWGARWAAGDSGGGDTIEHVVSTAGLHAELLDILDVPHDRDAVRPALSADTSGLAFVETDKGVARAPGVDPLRRSLRAVRGRDGLLLQRVLMPEERSDPQAPAFELDVYDLAADPAATAPVPDAAPPRELSAALDRAAAWIREHRARPPAAGADGAQFEALKALGYLGADASLERPAAQDGAASGEAQAAPASPSRGPAPDDG